MTDPEAAALREQIAAITREIADLKAFYVRLEERLYRVAIAVGLGGAGMGASAYALAERFQP